MAKPSLSPREESSDAVVEECRTQLEHTCRLLGELRERQASLLDILNEHTASGRFTAITATSTILPAPPPRRTRRPRGERAVAAAMTAIAAVAILIAFGAAARSSSVAAAQAAPALLERQTAPTPRVVELRSRAEPSVATPIVASVIVLKREGELAAPASKAPGEEAAAEPADPTLPPETREDETREPQPREQEALQRAARVAAMLRAQLATSPQ